MNNADFAINYNAVLLLTNKADRYCMEAFNKAESLAGQQIRSKPLYELSQMWSEVLGSDTSSLVRAWDRSARAFENLPIDTVILSPSDPLWPEDVTDVPFLYLRGKTEFLKLDGVCIVGTRTPSDQAVARTRAVVSSLDKEFVIISGLAMGIDGVSHIQTLSDREKTIAVIGTPINEYYPAQHRKLQDAIAESGLLVSRFAPCQETQKYFFMMRNLLMSQIGKASFVIESQDGGGGVSQAAYTEKQGKPVMVFKDTYENRTYLWPRKIHNPVLVTSAERSCQSLKTALGKKREKDIQPSLF